MGAEWFIHSGSCLLFGILILVIALENGVVSTPSIVSHTCAVRRDQLFNLFNTSSFIALLPMEIKGFCCYLWLVHIRFVLDNLTNFSLLDLAFD